MKVLIHALGAAMGGAERHLTSFIPHLAAEDRCNRYTVLVRQSFPEVASSESVRIERLQAGVFSRLRHDLIDLPRRLRSERFDATVSLTNFGPVWCPVPHVLFQRNPIYYSGDYAACVGPRQRAEAALRRRLAHESMRRAKVIVTPSHAMADMIRAALPDLERKPFRTLYHGFGAECAPLDEKYRRMLRDGKVRLLYPTHAAPHKGFEVLFETLSILKKRGLDFRLYTTICRDDWPAGVARFEQEITRRALRDQVVFMGRVPQSQMGALYTACRLMIYPSLVESFGFSMIEALNFRLPTVAAGTAVNREICGAGALYYPPLDARAAAAAIERALEPEMRHALLTGAAERLSSFDWSWRRYAAEFRALVES